MIYLLRKFLLFILNILFWFYIPIVLLILGISWIFKVTSWKDIQGKLGLVPIEKKNGSWIWFHVASLGEYNTLKPFLKKYKKSNSNLKILVTYFNKDLLSIPKSEKYFHEILPFPIENPYQINKILKSLNIKKVFFLENEFWFISLLYLYGKKIPIYLLNGFIQNREYRVMLSLYPVYFLILKVYHQCFVISDYQKDRFLKMGLPSHRVFSVGHLKYDSSLIPSNNSLSRAEALWSEKNHIIYCISFHQGEWKKLKTLIEKSPKHYRWIIAPRKLPQLSLKIQKDLQEKSIKYHLLSNGNPIEDVPVWIIDIFGITKKFYSLSDQCVVGGSFTPYGGHNLLEPIAYTKPTYIGPYYFHFKDIVEDFKPYIYVIKTLPDILNTPYTQEKAKMAYENLLKKSGASNRVIEILSKNDK